MSEEKRLCGDLTGVHIGDLLLVGGSGQHWNRLRVARITAKQVIVGEGRSATHYWKKSGNRVGDSGSYSYSFAYVYDDVAKEKWRELVAKARDRNLRRIVRNADWNKVPFNDVLDIASLLLKNEAFADTNEAYGLINGQSEQ
jgi:hypothetical protein